MFPTKEMKTALAMLFIHILDLLYRLAKYFDLGGLGSILLPLEKLY
jgi:hypothetical protein